MARAASDAGGAKPTKAAPPRKPLPHWLNQRAMAASCGISVQAFSAWNVKAAAKIGRETFYTVDDVVENRIQRHIERQKAAEPPPSETATKDLEVEKVLLTREQRIGQELKNARTRRELAPVQVLEWVLGAVGGQIAAQLEAIPLKVKRLVPRLTAAEIEHIKRELVKAQNAASRITVDLDEYYDRDPDADPSVDSSGT